MRSFKEFPVDSKLAFLAGLDVIHALPSRMIRIATLR